MSVTWDDDRPDFDDGPLQGWIFNERIEGVMFRADLYSNRCGIVAWDWREPTPESEGYYEKYRARKIYPTEAKALAALRDRFKRKIKRAQCFLGRIEKKLAALTAPEEVRTDTLAPTHAEDKEA